jgi:hypothetical protein
MLFNPLFGAKTRYRRAVSDARFQVIVLSDSSARAQTLGPTSAWRRSKIVNLIRRYPRLAGWAYWVDIKMVRPLGAGLSVAGSVVLPAFSAIFTVVYYFRGGKSRYVDAARQVQTQSDQGRVPVLLFAHDYMAIPDLARFGAEFAEQPENNDKFALIVPNVTVEAALKPLAGSATFVNMQQFWLDQSIDIANHDLVDKVLGRLRAALDRTQSGETGDGDKQRVDLFELMSMDLHVELVLMMRLARAMQAALDQGKRVIAICLGLSIEQRWCCQDILSSDSRPNIGALITAEKREKGLFSALDNRPSSTEMIERARKRLSDNSTPANQTVGSRSEYTRHRDPRRVALISDTMPGTHFWPTVLNSAFAANQSGFALRILVDNPVAAQALRGDGFTVDELPRTASSGASPGFGKAYTALLDGLAAAMASPEVAVDPIDAALQNHVTARLVHSANSYDSVLSNYTVREEIGDWLVGNRMGSMMVLPHWGKLAWAGVAAANALDIPSASTPAVSVAGNSASIVGWNWLDLIGCYGSQCREAFVSRG